MTVDWRNSNDTWGTVAKSFHWLIALLILAQFVVGEIAEDLKLSPTKVDLFVWHKSVGVLILLLAVLRLAWRLANPPPAAPVDSPTWETKLAAAGHFLLYALMFAVPISGWLISDASRVPFNAFFVISMPDFIDANRDLQKDAEDVHEILTTALMLIAAVHVIAALRHHYLLRNDVLRRMLPGRFRRESETQ